MALFMLSGEELIVIYLLLLFLEACYLLMALTAFG